jgi:hypothetical protein
MDWERRIETEIRDARQTLQRELGEQVIPVFAYPYGEYTTEVRQMLAGQERFGLGQHSGAVGPDSDFLALPRYPVATGLALDDFKLRARSRALPVTVTEPERHIVEDGEDRPPLHIVLNAADDVRLDELACYASGQGRMDIEWANEAMTSLVVRPTESLQPGRSKYNCTAPSKTSAGSWYWFGYLWMRRMPDGSWYPE